MNYQLRNTKIEIFHFKFTKAGLVRWSFSIYWLEISFLNYASAGAVMTLYFKFKAIHADLLNHRTRSL